MHTTHLFRLLLITTASLLFLTGQRLSAQKLTEYLPKEPAETAVIVCPGGSYFWLSKKTEGSEVAAWLNTHGMAAYVLEYPTAGWPAFAWHTRALLRGHQYPDQIRAMEQTLRLLRPRYRRIGAMGFSAGGHLVLHAAATMPDSIAPDFIAPIYPVVSMSADCTHRRSRRGLLGERHQHDRQLCDSLSMEKHAAQIRCPLFMINCKDDPVVHFHNAELMDSALTANGKPHLYIQYPTGGHGFGTTASKTSPEAAQWTAGFLQWLDTIGRNGSH